MNDLPVYASASQAARRLNLKPSTIPFLAERGFISPSAVDADGRLLYAIADVDALKTLRAHHPAKQGWPRGRARAQQAAS
jgi:DNA-binding transcriptional MerR regulator